SSLVMLEPTQYTAFKVKNMIDFGPLQKTLVLDGMKTQNAAIRVATDVIMPKTFENFNVLYTTKNMNFAPSITASLPASEYYKDVVADVLSPGDVLIFKKPHTHSTMLFSKALRSTG